MLGRAGGQARSHRARGAAPAACGPRRPTPLGADIQTPPRRRGHARETNAHDLLRRPESGLRTADARSRSVPASTMRAWPSRWRCRPSIPATRNASTREIRASASHRKPRCPRISTTPRYRGCRPRCGRSSSARPQTIGRPCASAASRRRRSRCCWCISSAARAGSPEPMPRRHPPHLLRLAGLAVLCWRRSARGPTPRCRGHALPADRVQPGRTARTGLAGSGSSVGCACSLPVASVSTACLAAQVRLRCRPRPAARRRCLRRPGRAGRRDPRAASATPPLAWKQRFAAGDAGDFGVEAGVTLPSARDGLGVASRSGRSTASASRDVGAAHLD